MFFLNSKINCKDLKPSDALERYNVTYVSDSFMENEKAERIYGIFKPSAVFTNLRIIFINDGTSKEKSMGMLSYKDIDSVSVYFDEKEKDGGQVDIKLRDNNYVSFVFERRTPNKDILSLYNYISLKIIKK